MPLTTSASGPDLLKFVQDVRPKVLIPIHTEEAGWWQTQLQDTGISICLPQLGSPIDLLSAAW